MPPKMMRFSLLLPFFALLPASLAAQQPPANAPRSVAGCWALTLGPWSPAIPASPAHTLPSRIALDTVAAEETTLRGSLRVRAVGGTAGTAPHVASWSPLPFRRDSLRIRWSTVGAGVDARLRARASELRGRATAFSVDAPGGAATATLVARRVTDCAAPPPPAARTAAAPAAVEGVTVVPGLEARGTPDTRAPDTRPERPRTPQVAEPEGLPRPPAPPIRRTEEVAGYVVGAAIAWMLVHLAGIL